jgi:hypothetical protein
MLEKLASLPWHRIRHYCGLATELPDLLRASIADGTFHEEAFWEFFNLICHQGSTSEASSAVVPFLVELATDPKTPNPHCFLLVLAEIAADPDNQSPHNCVADVLPAILPYLKHPTPAMRAGAAHVVAQFQEKAETFAPALRAAFRSEPLPLVKAGILLCLGKIADSTPETLSLIRETYASTADIRLHFASAIALINACPDELPGDLPVLLAQLARDHWIAQKFLHDLPWDWSVDADPQEALEVQLGVSVDDPPPLDTRRYVSSVPSLLADLRNATFDAAAGGLAATLVLIAFPNHVPIAAATRWSSLQCQVVRALLEADILWNDYRALAFLKERGIVAASLDKKLPKILRSALRQLLARQSPLA